MEKMIEMQKKRKEEKPVAMLIKGGMLFKDGKTTEEKKVDDDDDHEGEDVDQQGGRMLFKDGKTTKWFMMLDFFLSQTVLHLFQADDMGMTVKEMITMTEGLTRNEVCFLFQV